MPVDELLKNPLIISAAGGLLALVSGLLGFLVHSVKTYSKPMVRILGFDNRHLAASEEVRLEEDLIELLGSIRSAVLTTGRIVSVSDLAQIKGYLDRWERAVPNIRRHVDFYINAVKNSNIPDGEASKITLNAIRDMLSYDIFEGVLVSTIGRGYLNIPKPRAMEIQIIKVSKSKSNNGCYYAYLPEPVSLGRNLDEDPANEHYYKDFATLLANAEHSKLMHIFTQLVDILNFDLPALKDAKKAVDEIIGRFENYSASIYFANITTAPILIETNAELLIEGVKTDKGPVTAKMKLAIEEHRQNNKHYIPIEDAVVVPAGSDIRLFAYTLSRIQIENGSVIQAVFGDGSSKARVRLSTESVGLLSRKVVSTASRKFFNET